MIRKLETYTKYEIDPTKFELDSNRPLHAFRVLLGQLGVIWIPAILTYDPKWWRWN